MRWSLKGKKALITGGTEGIGRACLEEFIELGASVMFISRTAEKVEATEKELSAKYPNVKVYGISGDCASEDGRKNLCDAVKECFGCLDILVNNVGCNVRKPTVDFTEADYTKIIDLNMKSYYEVSRSLHPYLKDSGKGSIVNIGSTAGVTVVCSGILYGMSKAAVTHMTKYQAVEWAKDGIRVNMIAPWYTNTPLGMQVLVNKSYRDEVLVRTPLGRIAEPREVSGPIAYLCMDGPASYVTGQILCVDGGMTAFGFAHNL
eukprot:CFRG4514T1